MNKNSLMAHKKMFLSFSVNNLQLAILIILLLSVFSVRYHIATEAVTVHNDERHYAVDGLWVKSKIPAKIILTDLLYNHIRPHPLWHPDIEEVVYHGETQHAFPNNKGDMGPYPRAGHPALYSLLLGIIFSFIPKSYLLSGDNYVYVARIVNICLDIGSLTLLFDIFRKNFSYKISIATTFLLATAPFTLVYGSLAYLDSPGTFFATISIWYYITFTRKKFEYIHWLTLGTVISLSILIKQSNLLVIPAFISITLLFPPIWKTKKNILASSLCFIFSAFFTFILLCNPLGLYKEIQNPTDPDMSIDFSIKRTSSNFAKLLQPKKHYYFGVERHNTHTYVTEKTLIKLYEITTPIYIIIACISSIIILLNYGYRSIPLIAILLLFIAIIPMGSVIRRLYVFMPFYALIIALSLAIVSNKKRTPCKKNIYIN